MRDLQINKICTLIDQWEGKLTWDQLIEKVSPIIGRKMSRTGLWKITRIKNAYSNKKKQLRETKGSAESTLSAGAQKWKDKYEEMKTKAERLEQENHRLLEQFARWAYNSKKSLKDLNKALPTPDRDVSKR